ncbi:MAG: hypothetical protein ACP5IM_06440, partial [Candidatus Bathyarchaeia archaeon]
MKQRGRQDLLKKAMNVAKSLSRKTLFSLQVLLTMMVQFSVFFGIFYAATSIEQESLNRKNRLN